jgi:hypothetical protein
MVMEGLVRVGLTSLSPGVLVTRQTLRHLKVTMAVHLLLAVGALTFLVGVEAVLVQLEQLQPQPHLPLKVEMVEMVRPLVFQGHQSLMREEEVVLAAHLEPLALVALEVEVMEMQEIQERQQTDRQILEVVVVALEPTDKVAHQAAPA